mmetsp:Transcript_5857/g.8642  ORF Transcript_5857/g.8642 Transcript_5857/m.8642 type:complete len:205 (-) Transcript_5857:137-751(-)
MVFWNFFGGSISKHWEEEALAGQSFSKEEGRQRLTIARCTPPKEFLCLSCEPTMGLPSRASALQRSLLSTLASAKMDARDSLPAEIDVAWDDDKHDIVEEREPTFSRLPSFGMPSTTARYLHARCCSCWIAFKARTVLAIGTIPGIGRLSRVTGVNSMASCSVEVFIWPELAQLSNGGPLRLLGRMLLSSRKTPTPAGLYIRAI